MEAFEEYEIVVGTYEEFVLGYKIVSELKNPEKCELAPSFTVKSHCGPVRYITHRYDLSSNMPFLLPDPPVPGPNTWCLEVVMKYARY